MIDSVDSAFGGVLEEESSGERQVLWLLVNKPRGIHFALDFWRQVQRDPPLPQSCRFCAAGGKEVVQAYEEVCRQRAATFSPAEGWAWPKLHTHGLGSWRDVVAEAAASGTQMLLCPMPGELAEDSLKLLENWHLAGLPTIVFDDGAGDRTAEGESSLHAVREENGLAGVRWLVSCGQEGSGQLEHLEMGEYLPQVDVRLREWVPGMEKGADDRRGKGQYGAEGNARVLIYDADPGASWERVFNEGEAPWFGPCLSEEVESTGVEFLYMLPLGWHYEKLSTWLQNYVFWRASSSHAERLTICIDARSLLLGATGVSLLSSFSCREVLCQQVFAGQWPGWLECIDYESSPRVSAGANRVVRQVDGLMTRTCDDEALFSSRHIPVFCAGSERSHSHPRLGLFTVQHGDASTFRRFMEVVRRRQRYLWGVNPVGLAREDYEWALGVEPAVANLAVWLRDNFSELCAEAQCAHQVLPGVEEVPVVEDASPLLPPMNGSEHRLCDTEDGCRCVVS